MGIKNIREMGRKIYKNNPSIRPFVDFIRKKEPDTPRFSGWGMTSIHEFPWNDEYQGDVFRKASNDIKNKFDFVDNTTNVNKNRMDSLLWRHWNISYAARSALEFADTTEYNFVECGVAEGITSFFLLYEIDSCKKLIGKCFLHLYDSWAKMKEEHLTENEKESIGKYERLDLEKTKRNLSKFKIPIVFHQGYIPDSFYYDSPKSPDSICYLHIDLNSSKPTLASLEFFHPKLVKGGIIVFDDYAHSGYEDTKQVVDKFFSNKSGLLQKLATGQAIYYQH